MKRLVQITLAALLVMGLFSTTFAQNEDDGEINAEAKVLAAMNVTAVNHLSFGDVSPGVEKSVNYDESGAGQFIVSAGENASVELNFDLSDLGDESDGYALTNDSDDELEIVFGSNDANWEEDGDPASNGSNTFNPTGSSEQITSFPGTDINVYIGGEVQPTASQNAGTYNGIIKLSATYN